MDSELLGRERVKVVFLLRRISYELYYVDYNRCLSYEKFVRKREREMELRLFFLEEYELYYVDYNRCLSYEKFVRKRERERERES